jgi:hypothetical protein
MSGSELVATTSSVEVQFTNEGDVTADIVRFRFAVGPDAVSYVRDVGKFSPGVTVTHRFRQAEGETVFPLLARPKVKCSVETIHFIDGTVWVNPRPGPDESTATDTTT